MRDVSIYGAGLSGLTAAINLARQGYTVTVHEKEEQIGGSLHCQPSVHMTPIDLHKMHQYIGIDVEPCFTELEEFKGHIYSKIVTFNTKHLYVVERGSRSSSIENYLYRLAIEHGVIFKFSSPLTAESLDIMPENSIIATGGYSNAFTLLKLRHVAYKHYDAHQKTNGKQICLAFFDAYTKGYGYVSSKNNILSVQVGFTMDSSESNLEKFKNHLKKTENIEFNKWNKVIDNFARTTCLFTRLHKKTFILAGALSGFIDPIFGFGVNGAMVSGKIASKAFTSKKDAISDFKRFTHTLNKMYILDRFYYYLPFKKFIIPKIFEIYNTSLPVVGPNMKSIPGFVHDDCFQIIAVKKK